MVVKFIVAGLDTDTPIWLEELSPLNFRWAVVHNELEADGISPGVTTALRHATEAHARLVEMDGRVVPFG